MNRVRRAEVPKIFSFQYEFWKYKRIGQQKKKLKEHKSSDEDIQNLTSKLL